MQFLREATNKSVQIGPFIDDTDFKTQETGLTINASDVVISKIAATFAAKNQASACVHMAEGVYECALDATDTNTVGDLVVAVSVAGALPVRHDFRVVTKRVYDKYFSDTARGTTGRYVW